MDLGEILTKIQCPRENCTMTHRLRNRVLRGSLFL